MNEQEPTSTKLSISGPVEPKEMRAIRLTKRMRFTYFVHGIILPCILFSMSLAEFNPLGDNPWQSGELKDYVVMLLRPVAWYPFAPALFYAMLSLATWTIFPGMERKAWVRIGVYSGVVLALHFLVLLLAIHQLATIIVALIVWLCWHAVLWLLNYFWRRQLSIWHILTLTTLVAIAFAATQLTGDPTEFIFSTTLFLLMASPMLNFMAYVSVATRLYKSTLPSSSRQSMIVVVSLIAWLVAWLVAWRFAIIAMLDEYSKLPTTNPNCYLSNAAAFGHPRLTRAANRGDVTVCMRRLKFLEIVFKHSLPKIHFLCRLGYDALCPPLAALCQRYTLLASATCVLLMPVEVIAETVRFILRIEPRMVNSIYGIGD